VTEYAATAAIGSDIGGLLVLAYETNPGAVSGTKCDQVITEIR
jgi:hypothetical protein